LAQCLLAILLIQEKPFAKFAVMQSYRNIVSLKGITGGRSTQIGLKNFCMLPNVTQSFRLQKPNLESCGDEAIGVARGAKGPWPPQIFGKHSHFVL